MTTNSDIKRLAELKERSGRKEQSLFFIEGKRAVLEALTGSEVIRRIIVSLAANESMMPEIRTIAGEKGIEIEELPDTKFRKLSSTESSQGVIGVAAMRELSSSALLSALRPRRNASVLLLDRISDPGNLGTVLRSAAWFGIDGVLISEKSVDAYNPKVIRSAMAALSEVEVAQEVKLSDAIGELKSFGFVVVAAMQEAMQSYAEFDYPRRCAVIFGSEASGIAPDLLAACDATIAIPRVGKMESLNVGVAASIILSEMSRRKTSKERKS